MSIYWSRGDISYSMWFKYKGGSYSYNNFSSFDEGVESTNTEEGSLIKILKEFDINLPNVAIFIRIDDRNDEGIYEWSIDNYVDGEYITNVRLTAEYYSYDSVKYIPVFDS